MIAGRFEIKEDMNDYMRSILAIVIKDIADSIRNKSILSMMLSVTFLMVLYRVMPLISAGGDPPRLALYDEGHSDLVDLLVDNSQIEFVPMNSEQEMERFLGTRSGEVVGLVLPSDFDQALINGAPPELMGFMDHWVSETAATEQKVFLEGVLSGVTGKDIHIEVKHDQVFTEVDGWQPYMVSLAMIVLLTMMGLMVPANLMFEEKESGTLDALMVSPTSSGQLVFSKAIVGLMYCLLTSTLVLAFNQALVVHWGVAFLAVICGSFFTVSMGLLLGNVVDSRQKLSTIVFILVQPLLLPVALSTLTGILPGWVNVIFDWIPTVALSQVFRIALINNVSLAQVAPKLVYVVGSAVVLLIVVAWMIRRRDLV